MKTKIIFASIFAVIFLSFGAWSVFAAINYFRANNTGFALQDGKFYTTSDKDIDGKAIGNA